MVGYRQRNRIAKTPTGNRKGSRVTEMIPPKQILVIYLVYLGGIISKSQAPFSPARTPR